MNIDWKSAIVRVAQDATAIQHTILERARQGWLLHDQCASAEAGKIDLVFRVASRVPQR